MLKFRVLDFALATTRILTYSILVYSIFYLAMCLGRWYAANILSSTEEKLELELHEDLSVRDLDNQVAIFVGMSVIVAAALGGVYEALWELREKDTERRPIRDSKARGTSVTSRLRSILRFQFKPVIGFALWMTVGEFLAIVLWFIAMAIQMWQAVEKEGSHYNENVHPCPDNPSRWCSREDGLPVATPAQWRLRMLAVFFGFMASSHFAVILIPVSRDSKLLAALGIPFERAVLYHKFAGHLAFVAVVLHMALFIIVWVWQEGWDHVLHRSIHGGDQEHGGMSLPSGWMAFLFMLPMWVFSIGYIRRRYYSLFKLTHWMFVGVLFFAAMHWAPNAAFYLGGLSLYSLHVYSRLSSWKRWRRWNRWLHPKTMVRPTSVVHVLTSGNYTRLVLRNPKDVPPRGGAFVYISAPPALGTDEAHAFTVALRGPPPGVVLDSNTSPGDVHTLYIKSCGVWTRALALTAKGAESSKVPESLLVDVDGFYDHVESFKSMMLEGSERIIVITGGSGMTCFMCMIQDWAAAARTSHTIPDVRVLWCCRDMQEMRLVGEALPSIVSSAGELHQSRISLELYCSDKGVKDRDDLSLTWSVDHLGGEQRIFPSNNWASLKHSFLVLLVGAAGYGGWLLGHYESHRRDVRTSFHEGSTTVTIMVAMVTGTLLIYRLLCDFFSRGFRVGMIMKSSAKIGSSKQETKQDLEASVDSATFAVKAGRIPTRIILEQEALTAEAAGLPKVKVLVSGPSLLVDSVLMETRSINWRLFDTEAFSFEF